MKRTILSTALALCMGGAFAQSSAFQKLSKIKDVEYVNVDKSMINLAAAKGEGIKFGDNTIVGDNSGEILRDLDNVMVFTCEKAAGAAKLKKAATKILKGKQWNSLMDVAGDDGEKVKICQAKEGDKTTNVVFVEEDDETTLVVLTGKFDLAKMMEQMSGDNDDDDDDDEVDDDED